MAGFHAGRGNASTTSIHFKASQTTDYPWLLESYHYYTEEMGKEIRSKKRTIFLDSGAFSMFTQGVKVDLQKYGRFIFDNQDIIHLASNLDVIGKGGEQESYDRFKKLEKWLTRSQVKVQPVHHVRDRNEWLQRYLDEGYDYIFLGGMVPENTPTLLKWLDEIWAKYLVNPDGTPRVKVHGFGLTTLVLMFRYPWFSVDSTSWVMTSRFGGIYLDVPQPDGTIRDYKVDFSLRSPKIEDTDSWHFNSLKKPQREVVLQRLEQLEAERVKVPEVEAELEAATGWKPGYNPKALGESYGWRDHFNINYFRRAQARGAKTFKPQQLNVFDIQ
jgi:hypothetical protein